MIIHRPEADARDSAALRTALTPTRSTLVVIATRNRRERLMAAVRSVLSDESATHSAIIVVDQSDTDGSLRLLAQQFSGCNRVQYIWAPGHGAAAARNLAVSLSQSEIIAITDDDCVVPAGWAASILNLYTAHPEVDVLYGAVDPVAHDSLRSFVPTFSPRERRFETSVDDALDFRGMGAHMAVRRTVFEALGGFDERFGPGSLARSAEDFELHFRALCAGYTVLVEPSVRVVHNNARPMAKTWDLWRRDAHAVGALAAHMLLQGRGLAAWRVWCGVVGRPALCALGRLFRGRRPTGLRCVSTLACGFGVGLAHWLWWMHPALSTRRGPRPTFERFPQALASHQTRCPTDATWKWTKWVSSR